jgi:hypothetical protein
MGESMQMVLGAVQRYCWAADIAGLALMILTRIFFHSRRAWGVLGLILLAIAAANAIAIGHVGLNPSQTAASIFGLVVLDSLGSRFAANWITDGAA